MKGGGDDFIINMLSQKGVAVINTRFYELQLIEIIRKRNSYNYLNSIY